MISPPVRPLLKLFVGQRLRLCLSRASSFWSWPLFFRNTFRFMSPAASECALCSALCSSRKRQQPKKDVRLLETLRGAAKESRGSAVEWPQAGGKVRALHELRKDGTSVWMMELKSDRLCLSPTTSHFSLVLLKLQHAQASLLADSSVRFWLVETPLSVVAWHRKN